MTLRPGFVTNAATQALDGRFHDAGLFVKNADGSTRLGILSGPPTIVTATSSMQVVLQAPSTFVVSRATSDGVIVIPNFGSTSVTLDAAPSANSRYDVVYVKHNDDTQGDSNAAPVFGKVTGVAAAQPTVPAVPIGALALATILIPAGVQATNASGVVFTQAAQFTALQGSPIQYRSASALQSDTSLAADGLYGFVAGGPLWYRSNGYWKQANGDTFVQVTQTGGSGATLGSGTTPAALSGPTGSLSYSSSDTNFFPQRSDGLIVPAVSGWYEIMFNLSFSSSSTGNRYASLFQNNTEINPVIGDQRNAANTSGNLSSSGMVYLNAGDQLSLRAWQNSGATLTFAFRFYARLVRVLS